MPKLPTGRLSGVWGMRTFTADELDDWANKLERQIDDPANTDDPKWLRRWVARMRKLAEKKRKSRAQKRRDRKG